MLRSWQRSRLNVVLFGVVNNSEQTDSLGLQRHLSVRIRWLGFAMAILSCPVEPLRGPLWEILVVPKSTFHDWHGLGQSLIDTLVKLGCISIYVKHRRNGWCYIEKICNVFNSDQNLIFGFSEKVDLEVTIKFNYWLRSCWLLGLLASQISKHVLNWFISM